MAGYYCFGRVTDSDTVYIFIKFHMFWFYLFIYLFIYYFVCVFVYFLLIKTIKNYKTVIKITTITGKSIKKYSKAASYNIKLTCTRQTSIQKWG